MARYTGNSDGDHGHARVGLIEFVKTVDEITDHALWNNGTYANRNMRGKSTLSVHATGRAVDLSWRKFGRHGRSNGLAISRWFCKLLATNAELMGIECILDYHPAPWGRGWRCDRGTWEKYSEKTIEGAPGGDWLHVELTPKMADSRSAVREAFSDLAASGALTTIPGTTRGAGRTHQVTEPSA